jgi:hypothetical protein
MSDDPVVFERAGVGQAATGRLTGSRGRFGEPFGFLLFGGNGGLDSSASVKEVVFADMLSNKWQTTRINLVTGDTSSIPIRLKKGGLDVDLTTATAITMRWRSSTAGTLKVNRSLGLGVITSATTGQLSFEPISADVNTAGLFWAEIQVDYTGGASDTFPNAGTVLVDIRAKLAAS